MIERRQNGQSILEYTTLIGVVIAALLIMQMFIKRGYQGGLKESADKLGDTFSAGGTTIYQKRSMGKETEKDKKDQLITEEIATNDEIEAFLPKDKDGKPAYTLHKVAGKGVYSYSERSNVEQTAETKVLTETASAEKTRLSEYSNTTVPNFAYDKIDF